MPSSPDPDARTTPIVRVAACPLAGRVAAYMLAVHVAILLALALWKAFNSDEFEHVHIAWNGVQGLLVYRDFFDNHGPLFALWNQAVWRLLSLPDDARTLLAFRLQALAWAAALLWLTARIAREVGDRRHARVAAAALSGCLVFLDKAVEIRPDGPQCVAWLAAVLFALRAARSQRPGHAALAGACLGLSLAANTKMLAGVAAFGALHLALLWQGRRRPGHAGRLLRAGAAGAAGLVAAQLPFFAWFAAQGALDALLHFTWTVNFAAAAQVEATRVAPDALAFLATHPFLVVAAGGGAVALLRRRTALDPPARSALLVLTGVPLLLARGGYHTQYYLVFLPLLTVLAALFVLGGIEGRMLRRTLVGLLVLQTAAVWLQAAGLASDGRRRMQLEEMAFVMAHTPADEPVGFTGLDQGGYVFRPDVQFYWTNSDDLQRVMSRLEGRPVFGPDYVAALERQRPTFIISLDSGWAKAAFPDPGDQQALAHLGVSVRSFPAATQRYIAEHYVELEKLHLLVRRERLTPALRADAERLAERLPSGAEALGVADDPA